MLPYAPSHYRMVSLCLGMDLLRPSRAMQLFSQLSHRYESHTAEETGWFQWFGIHGWDNWAIAGPWEDEIDPSTGTDEQANDIRGPCELMWTSFFVELNL